MSSVGFLPRQLGSSASIRTAGKRSCDAQKRHTRSSRKETASLPTAPAGRWLSFARRPQALARRPRAILSVLPWKADRSRPPALEAAGPVHTITVVSQTPLFVRVTQPVEISPDARFQAEIEQDIRVNDQVAVPKGSVCRLE